MPRSIFRTKITGQKELKKAFKEQPEKVRLGAIDAIEIITRLVLNRSGLKIIKGTKSGKIYSRGGKSHQASAPGESPASDTGKLVGSGERDVDKRNPNVIWGLVGYSAFYARFLELGTRFMARRPFLLPTVDELRDKMKQIFRSSIVERLRKK